MKVMRLLSFILLFFTCATCGHVAAEWRSRTIYQVFTDRFARSSNTQGGCNLSAYCGGSFRGIVDRLDYITGMGFDAIWISPIIENTDGGYHGYWAKHFYRFNSHFGNETDFRYLLDECHKRNVWVMVDVVANHVGPVGTNYSSIYPFNSAEHYHDCNGCPWDCNISDWGNQNQVEHCRLSGLPDLNHENTYVYSELLNWISWLSSNFSIDGFRVDTIPEAPKDFWKDFNAASKSFCLGECYNGDLSYVSGYQTAMDSVFSYPLYYTLKDVYMYQKSLFNLESRLKDNKAAFRDITVLGNFIDNHDQNRWLNMNNDYDRYKNALAFTLLADGIPVIYYGTEQGYAGGADPNNREPLWDSNYNTSHDLYKFITMVNSVRNTYHVWNYEQIQRYADNDFYAFSRGDIFVATTNVGQYGYNVSKTITYHPYANGQVLCNIFWENDCVTVANKQFTVTLLHGEVKVYVPK